MNVGQYGLEFHHFGLAVRSTGSALNFLQGLGYKCAETVFDPLQKVNLIWCQHPQMPAVEIVAPSDEPGPLDNILSGQTELIYHLCYQSGNIIESVAAIKKSGVRVLPVVEPKPAVLFGGKLVGFYHIKGFGLIEIVEET